MALGPTKGPERGDALEPADLRVSCQAGEESGSLRCWFTRGARAVRTKLRARSRAPGKGTICDDLTWQFSKCGLGTPGCPGDLFEKFTRSKLFS